MLHSFTLKDLQMTKMPIFYMERHPIYDNYILVASDNQLRLLNIQTEQFCKTYQGRFNNSEVS